MTHRSRAARATLPLLLLAVALGGCEMATEPEPVRPVATPATANASPAPVGGTGTSAGTAASAGASAAATSAPGTAPTPAATPKVFGAFRRSPVTPEPELLEAAERACRSRPVPVYMSEIGDRPLVVADARGERVLILVFADAAGAAGCEVELTLGGEARAYPFRIDAGATGPVGSAEVTLDRFELVARPTAARTIAVGRVGDGARWVRAGFDDDTYITAAIEDGWYAMWWPGGVRPATIVASDSRNVVIAAVTPEG